MDYENLSRTNSVDMDSFISSPKCITADATSPLAIHVYSKLAKLHKHTLIPYLPRIMDSVLASISSSLQLHPACVQVVAALATYTIDSSRDPASNEETFRSLCEPLLSALSSCHPLHLSEGAASCLKGLVESDRWRCAPLDLQEAVCAKGMEALTNKCTHKVAHVELMQTLTKFSSCVVIQGYGAPLLAVGMDMLQTSSDPMMRIAVARLLEGILKVADAELLDLDLSPIVGALQEYQQDEVAGVRTAATDSLKIDNSYMLSENIHVPSMCHESHGNSPASDCLSMVNGGLRSWKAPCPSTLFLSMPSSKKFDKSSHRLPLAPLHQPSIVNSGHAPVRKHPASKHSELKENVAPTLHGRVHASKNGSKVARVPEEVSPLLWPQRAINKKQLEDWSLFDSPHTPIVSFHDEPHERDSSVTTLLEKHFGKQKYFFEEEFDVCLENTAGNKLCSSRKGATCIKEGNSSDMEDNRFLNQEFCRSSSDTLGTDMCRGIEGICSQDEENSTECRSEITSDQESSPQNQALNGDVMISRSLVRTLQFDDDYISNVDEENLVEFEAGTSDSTGYCLSDVGDYEGDYHEDMMAGRGCTEIHSSSAYFGISCEEAAQKNMDLGGTKSTLDLKDPDAVVLVKEKMGTPSVYLERSCFDGIKAKPTYHKVQNCDLDKVNGTLQVEDTEAAISKKEKIGTLASVYLEKLRLEDIKAKQPHTQVQNCHLDVDENHSSSMGLHYDAQNQSSVSNVKPEVITVCKQKTHTSSFWQRARYISLLVIFIGLILAGLETYKSSLEASNMLVPT